MRAKNHNITAAFLLVLVLAPLSYSFIFQAKQHRIREQMKEEMEHSLLQQVVIPATQLHWVKAGKEILLGNRMFDIKNIEYREDGNAYISGLFDEEETALVKQLKNDFEKEKRTGTREIVRLFQLVQSLPENASYALHLSSIALQYNSTPGPEALPVVYKNILTPPPQA